MANAVEDEDEGILNLRNTQLSIIHCHVIIRLIGATPGNGEAVGLGKNGLDSLALALYRI